MSTKQKGRPKAAFSIGCPKTLDHAQGRPALLPTIGHEADAEEAQDHHGPGGGLRDRGGEALKVVNAKGKRGPASVILNSKVFKPDRNPVEIEKL